ILVHLRSTQRPTRPVQSSRWSRGPIDRASSSRVEQVALRINGSDAALSILPGTIMSSLIRLLGVWLILAAGALVADTRAQNAGGGPKAPARRPFAKPGTPRRTERIRSVDVKHIKAILTIDVKKREVRGT